MRYLTQLLLLGLLLTLMGCGDAAYPPSARYHFQPYKVLEGSDAVKVYELTEDKPEQLDELLLPVFGTPFEPQVKLEGMDADLHELHLTPESMAAGSKFYLAQCAQCHGKEGNGNGKAAFALNPKPRDYRLGKFKYVSTLRHDDDNKPNAGQASYPSIVDIHRTIQMGLDGSGMTSFNQPADRIDAIASYVIHLALRGMVEYRLTRLWLEEDEKPTEKDVVKELKEIVKQWASDARHTITPAAPWEEIEREGQSTQWAKGKDLFLNKAGCTDCHGKNGMAKVEELPNIAAMKDDWGGAIKPRSFVSEPFRGGSRPIDLFYRIRLGIKPSRMQAIDSSKFSDADVWNLVGYIQSLREKK